MRERERERENLIFSKDCSLVKRDRQTDRQTDIGRQT